MSHESLVGLAQRGLRVEALFARCADKVEQQLAQELRIVDVDGEIDAWRDHADSGGTLLQPLRGEERREILRNAAEDALSILFAVLRRALFALDALPLPQEVAAFDRHSFEHVRVPPDQLLAETARDVRH